jgi:hypothetical protein
VRSNLALAQLRALPLADHLVVGVGVDVASPSGGPLGYEWRSCLAMARSNWATERCPLSMLSAAQQ